jgi:hypothetical protein
MMGSILTFLQVACSAKSGLPDGKLLTLACPRESQPAAPVLRTSRFVRQYTVAQKGVELNQLPMQCAILRGLFILMCSHMGNDAVNVVY